MKRRTTLSVLFVLLVFLLNVNTSQSQVRFGIRGGLDVVSNRINEKLFQSQNKLGVQVGGVMELGLPLVGFGGEIAVLYGYQKYEVKDVDVSVSNYHYIMIPLNAKQRFRPIPALGLFLAAGPLISFKLDGEKAEMTEISEVVDHYKTKTFAAGFNVGGGISFLKNLELGMYYRKILTDNYSDQKPGLSGIWRNRPDNWTVNLTCFF
ncbi:MAG: hypothetical protein RL662_1245 [Bacteroidota bacterium]|jgi:hypothetical protein